LTDLIEFLDNIEEWKAAIAILLIMTLQSPFLTFPGYIIMIYSGFKFGLINGMIINFVSLYISCIVGYRFGYWSSIDMTSNKKLQKFDNIVKNKGIKAIIVLRIIPLIPNNFTSIGSGFTKIPEKNHSAISLLCIIQSCFWAWLGSTILKSKMTDISLEITYIHFIGLILLICLLIYSKYRLKPKSDETEIE